jgi:hypothetical protein
MSHHYPLDKRVGEARGELGHSDREKSPAPMELNPLPSLYLVAMRTDLVQLTEFNRFITQANKTAK